MQEPQLGSRRIQEAVEPVHVSVEERPWCGFARIGRSAPDTRSERMNLDARSAVQWSLVVLSVVCSCRYIGSRCRLFSPVCLLCRHKWKSELGGALESTQRHRPVCSSPLGSNGACARSIVRTLFLPSRHGSGMHARTFASRSDRSSLHRLQCETKLLCAAHCGMNRLGFGVCV